jgi:hypothetical protein
VSKNYFEFGEPIDLMELPEELAKQLVGTPLYEALRERVPENWKGSYRVRSVNREKRTVTIEWRDADE